MDKYDEKAYEVCPQKIRHANMADGIQSGVCDDCVGIAQALRESAAQAFEEAASNCEDRSAQAFIEKMPGVLTVELGLRATHYRERAAAIRSGDSIKKAGEVGL